MNHATTAASLLDWCTEQPHTIDQVIGLHAETAMPSTGLAAGKNPMQLAHALKHSGAGSGIHSDPTATHHSDPTDPTIEAIDAATSLIVTAANQIDRRCAELAGHTPVTWTTKANRTDRLRAVVSLIHRNTPHLRNLDDERLAVLVRCDLYDTTEWLHNCLLGIWKQSKGDTKPEAKQRTLAACSVCSPWRSGTIATVKGMCSQCANFQYHHKVKPTEAIVRRWEATGSGATPPGMILEAQAASRRKVKARA